MPDDPNQIVGYGFEVTDGASKPLGKIDKAYANVVKTMDETMRKMPKAMSKYSEATREAGEATEDAGKKQEKHTNNLSEAAKALKKDALSLDKLGISWNNLIKILGAVTAGAAIYGLFQLFKGMIVKAYELQKQVARLNEVFHMTKKESAVAAGAIEGMTYRFGWSRDEAVGLTRAMLDLGMKPGKAFKKLAFSFQEIAAATGASGESVAKFGDEVKRVMLLPDISVRKLGAAIKYVADESRISADELMSMTGTISKLVLLSGGASDSVRTDLAASLFGLAGALKDADVNAESFFGTVSEMQMGWISDAGARAAGALATYSSVTAQGLMDLAKANPARLMDELANTATRFSTESEHGRLELKELADAFGMSYVDILKVRDKAAKGQGDFFQQAAGAAKKAATKEKAAADAAAARQAKLEGMANRFRKLWDRISIMIGGKLLRVIEKRLLPPVEKFFKTVTSKEINDTIDKTVTTISDIGSAVKFVGKIVGSVFSFVGNRIALVASIFTNLFGAAFELFSGNTTRAKDLFFEAFDNILEFFTGPFKEGFKSAMGKLWDGLKSGASSVWRWFKEGNKQIWESLKSSAKSVWEWMSTKAKGFVALILSPFTGISEGIQNQLDKLLVWLGKEIAPKLKSIGILGMGDIGAALEGAGTEAAVRVKTRDEVQKREAERKLAEVRSRTSSATTAAAAINFPASMATTSPVVESTLKSIDNSLRDMKNQKVGVGVSPSATKAAYVMANG